MGVRIENNDKLRKENPFTVPEGYFENLTEQILSKIPEKSEEVKLPKVGKQVSLMERIRPWLYMAAVFAGLGFFFKGIMKVTSEKESVITAETQDSTSDPLSNDSESEAYFTYFENKYYEDLLAERLNGY